MKDRGKGAARSGTGGEHKYTLFYAAWVLGSAALSTGFFLLMWFLISTLSMRITIARHSGVVLILSMFLLMGLVIVLAAAIFALVAFLLYRVLREYRKRTRSFTVLRYNTVLPRKGAAGFSSFFHAIRPPPGFGCYPGMPFIDYHSYMAFFQLKEKILAMSQGEGSSPDEPVVRNKPRFALVPPSGKAPPSRANLLGRLRIMLRNTGIRRYTGPRLWKG
jgi:hypothetical protein